MSRPLKQHWPEITNTRTIYIDGIVYIIRLRYVTTRTYWKQFCRTNFQRRKKFGYRDLTEKRICFPDSRTVLLVRGLRLREFDFNIYLVSIKKINVSRGREEGPKRMWQESYYGYQFLGLGVAEFAFVEVIVPSPLP